VATSLGAKQVCQQAYNISQTHDIRSVLVSDKEAVEACFAFLNDHRVLVEPACGAGLAAIYAGKVDLSEFENVLMIVCGGSTTPIETLTQYRTAL
jgi:L-serine/L-threonine ammonia-lyase